MDARGWRLRVFRRKIVTNGGAQEHTEFASQFFRHKNIRTYLFSHKGRGNLFAHGMHRMTQNLLRRFLDIRT